MVVAPKLDRETKGAEVPNVCCPGMGKGNGSVMTAVVAGRIEGGGYVLLDSPLLVVS